MKKTLLAFLLMLLVLPAVARARIGETENDFKARYGRPVKTGPAGVKVYKTQYYRIRARFRANKAVSVTYSLLNGGAISTERLSHLLHKNGSGARSINYWYINGTTPDNHGVLFIDRGSNNVAVYDFVNNTLTISAR